MIYLILSQICIDSLGLAPIYWGDVHWLILRCFMYFATLVNLFNVLIFGSLLDSWLMGNRTIFDQNLKVLYLLWYIWYTWGIVIFCFYITIFEITQYIHNIAGSICKRYLMVLNIIITPLSLIELSWLFWIPTYMCNIAWITWYHPILDFYSNKTYNFNSKFTWWRAAIYSPCFES